MNKTNTTSNSLTLNKSPLFWTMTALMVVGTIFLLQENLSITLELGLDALVALGTWVGFGLVVVVILFVLQRHSYQPSWVILLALFWGALGAAALAQHTNIAVSTIIFRIGVADLEISSWTTTPLVEETLKLLGVLGLALIPAVRLRRSLDGLFYGVLVGLGFLVCESFFYSISALINNPGNLAGNLFAMLIIRGLLGGIMTHPIFTGIIGTGIGYALTKKDKNITTRGIILAATIGLSMTLHSFWNQQSSVNINSIIVGIIGFAVLLILLFWSRRNEKVT